MLLSSVSKNPNMSQRDFCNDGLKQTKIFIPISNPDQQWATSNERNKISENERETR
jgi:hypothetical protein